MKTAGLRDAGERRKGRKEIGYEKEQGAQIVAIDQSQHKKKKCLFR